MVLGKPEVVRLALTALFAQGHVLLEDVPGVGKTTLARAIAASMRGQWRRIQFTPDLLPSDVSGVTIFNQASRGFEFHPGPVFANIVIADEINRASPKTQSALLEVMEERRVTVDGVPHPVPQPFLVVATQNPVEMDGTYRLPEAQLDRFLVKLSVGYPDEEVEVEVLRGAAAALPGHPRAGHRHGHRRRDGADGAAGAHRRPALRVRGPAGRGHPQPPAGAGRGQPAWRDRADPGGQRVRADQRPRVRAARRTSRRWSSRSSRTGVLLSPDAQLRGVTAAEVLRRRDRARCRCRCPDNQPRG